MKKGLIIIGYPGIGKTSRAGKDNCIDLEISCFGDPEDTNARDFLSYCDTAINLALQGYTVFISSHKQVRDYLHHIRAVGYKLIPIVIICPPIDLKYEWFDKLEKRYKKTGLEKDLRALRHVYEHYADDIIDMVSDIFPVYQFNNMDYDLDDYISKARKEFCKE